MKKFRLTVLRKQMKLSQLELSRRSGVPPSEINRLEKGKIYPYPGWKRKLALALNADPNTLFDLVKSESEVNNEKSES